MGILAGVCDRKIPLLRLILLLVVQVGESDTFQCSSIILYVYIGGGTNLGMKNLCAASISKLRHRDGPSRSIFSSNIDILLH